jgi:hypothetical protein
LRDEGSALWMCLPYKNDSKHFLMISLCGSVLM